jgi:DNA polymerase-3 subunit alpha
LLQNTYGIMLYQEDVLSVSRNLAGFTPGEADDLRKAIGKKLMDKIGLFREKFVQGCKETHDVHADVANKIYSDIEFFGGYGFNLAHAASYAMVSYITAYLKFNFPAEYMAALLTSVSNKEKAAPYLNECRSMGIEVLPPSINKSDAAFTVEDEHTILFGLESIDGIGPAVVERIITSRTSDYTSMLDYLRRTDPEVLNKAILEHLAGAGAFDEIIPEQESRIMSRDEKMVILDREREELGLFVSEHPLSGIWHIIESHISSTIEDLDGCADGEVVSLGVLLTKVEPKTTRRGDLMYKLIADDITGSIEVVVFPKDAKGRTFIEGEILIIDGRLSVEGDDGTIKKIFFSDMKKPDIPEFGTGEPIIITCSSKPGYDTLKRMHEVIVKHKGDSPVYIEYLEGFHVVSLRFSEPTSTSVKESLELIGVTISD